MEILYTASLLVFALSIAGRHSWKPLGWIVSWCTLLALAGSFRIFMQWFPHATPIAALVTVPIFAAYAGTHLRVRWDRQQILIALPWMFCAGFLFIRSYFGQFDVDSIEYHLVSVRWLQDRHWLNAIQQHAEALTNWLCVVGFEEFLSIPGLAGDLPLCGGLVGGVLKVMTLLTLISFIPSKHSLLRYVASFLLLIDDHFFFSGQSTWVYLNPSLLGLLPLLLWTSWRASKGSSRHLWLGLALAMGVASVKLYGLFFAPLPFLAWAIRRCYQKDPLRQPDWIAMACFLFVGIAGWSTFGFRWMDTGRLFPPMGATNLLSFYRGQEAIQHYFYSGSLRSALSHPLHNMIFPGALAMKMTAVLIIPALFLWVLLHVEGIQKKSRVDRRLLGLSCAAFLVALAWVIAADVIYHGESRYPRYVLGLAIMGLMFLAMALRKPFRRFTLPKNIQWGIGFCLFLWLAGTIDTRYVNVGTAWRPHWKNMAQLAMAKIRTGGKANSLDVSAPYTEGLFMSYVPENIPALSDCLAKLEQKTGQKLTKGEGLVIGPSFQNWPSLLLANNAIELGFTEGGGYLRLPGGKADLAAHGIRYAIVHRDLPSDGREGPFVRRGLSGPLEGLAFEATPLCVSQDMQIVKLR